MLIESRDIAIASALAVFALLLGFFVGRQTPSAAETAPIVAPAPAEPRPTAAEAKTRADAMSVAQAQIAGLTARLGGGRVAWGEVPVEQRPARFYERVRALRQGCDVRFNLVGIECAEPPCIALLRPVGDDLAAVIADCAAWTDAFPGEPSIDAAPITCDGGRTETAVLLSPPDADVAHVARLAERRAAIRAGWTCASTITP